jgi:hypothetical protein
MTENGKWNQKTTDLYEYVLRDKDPELRKLWAEVCGKDE